MMRNHALQVTLLGVSKDLEACGRMAAAQRLLNAQVQYACLQHEHFEPFTVATQPFEQLSHAVLQWLVQHQEDCDVVQASMHPCSAFLLPVHPQHAWALHTVGAVPGLPVSLNATHHETSLKGEASTARCICAGA